MYKSILNNKKAAVFDLDGTLVDTEPLATEALIKVLDAEKAPTYLFEGIVETPGVSSKLKWAAILNTGEFKTSKSIEQLVEETKNVFIKLIEASELEAMPGFWSLARVLKIEKGFKLGLVTNTDKALAEKILNKIEVNETFDYKIFGDEVKNPKPSPEIYLKAFKQMGIKPSEALVFEDSPVGVEAALRAKADVVLLWHNNLDLSQYPKGYILQTITFDGLAENLDHTFEEAYKEFKEVLLSKEAEKTNQQTQKQPH